MPRVAGVDGCRAGWMVVLLKPKTQRYTLKLFARFAEVLAFCPPTTLMALDIPIGLLAQPRAGGRVCDREARRLLGLRASSVFTPPSRSLLKATRYGQVRPHGVSRQAFGILPKIRAVDSLMTPKLQGRVFEAHPELAFLSLAGSPMVQSKKTPAGREERLWALGRILEPPFCSIRQVFADALQLFNRPGVAPDDLLDAWALAWTARRIAKGEAQRLPPDPPLDSKGLRMEVWY